MAGLCAPLSTLRQYPHGHLRMTRGRCGSLFLHRDGLAPSTPCRSPGALRTTPMNGHRQTGRVGPLGANSGHLPSPTSSTRGAQLAAEYTVFGGVIPACQLDAVTPVTSPSRS